MKRRAAVVDGKIEARPIMHPVAYYVQFWIAALLVCQDSQVEEQIVVQVNIIKELWGKDPGIQHDCGNMMAFSPGTQL